MLKQYQISYKSTNQMLVGSSQSQPLSEMDLISGSTGRQGLQLFSFGSKNKPKGTVIITQSSIATFLKSLSKKTKLQTQRWFNSKMEQKMMRQRWIQLDQDWDFPQQHIRINVRTMQIGTVTQKQVNKSPIAKNPITLKLFTFSLSSPMLSTNNLQRYKQTQPLISKSQSSIKIAMKVREILMGVLCSARKLLSAIQATKISSRMKLNPQAKQKLIFVQFSVLGAVTFVFPLDQSPCVQITN